MPLDNAAPPPAANPYQTRPCGACGEPLARCMCYGSRSIRYASVPTTFYGAPSARFPRYVGIEIECGTERDSTRTWAPLNAALRETGASVHDDGSIAFPVRMEVVTQPARGDAAETHIRAVCQGLQAVGAAVNESCGLHVHVDARDFTVENYVGLALVVSRVEKTLYSIVSRSRRGEGARGRRNTFAMPWGAALVANGVDDLSLPLQTRYERLLANLYGSLSTALSYKDSGVKHGSRYHGVSFNAFDIRKTFEFRLHHGTVNARKITMWAAVCSALVQFAKDHTHEEIMAIRGTPAEILAHILTDREVSRWVRVRRRFFEDRDRARRGLPPRAARATVTPAEAPLPPETDPATEEEAGEVRPVGARMGRRMSY